MRVTIRNRYWDWRFVRNLGRDRDGKRHHGKCDPPDKPNKAISILRGLPLNDELDTTLHEILHGGCWDLDEDAVTEIARDAAKILIDLGWTKI